VIERADQPPPPARVLIIKPSSLGDVVTAVPVLRGLRRTFPRSRLAWMLSERCSPLMRHDSDLDEVVGFDRRRLGRAWRSPGAAAALTRFLWSLRRGRYDWVIDLQGLARSGIFARATGAPVRAGFADAREGAALFYNHPVRVNESHTVERNIALARALGIDARGEDMTLQVPPEGRTFAEEFSRRHGLGPGGFLVCVPPTRWPTKQYPVRHWRRVVRAMAEELPVVVLGAPGDRELCQAVVEGGPEGLMDLSGQTDIPRMVALIAASAGVICSDSAAKFIAPAVGVGVVTLLGPTRIEQTGPYPRGKAILADIPCQGCLKRRCPHVTCMQVIDPADVISAARDMLAAARN